MTSKGYLNTTEKKKIFDWVVFDLFAFFKALRNASRKAYPSVEALIQEFDNFK